MACAACAPLPYHTGAYPGPYARVNPYVSRYRPDPAATAVVGRWDNVMMLAAGTPVQVLMMDGRKASGGVASADGETLRLLTASGEITVAADDVMRVDRGVATVDYTVAAGRGALVGAGVVGVMGLIAGHMPPPRLFGAGAIIGAASGVQSVADVAGPTTIYLSPRVRGIAQ
jgi:hypothetical protein